MFGSLVCVCGGQSVSPYYIIAGVPDLIVLVEVCFDYLASFPFFVLICVHD